jgi:tRNA pseudouridine13 synthase
LRSGHLRGNRFSILVRDVAPAAIPRARELLVRIERDGFPNYFGRQRFGVDSSTLVLGCDLLTGKQTPRDLPPSRRRFLLKLALSAVQSDLFNAVLADRIRDGLLRQVLAGDVMLVVATGGRFVAEDAAAEQVRLEQGEIVISGPIFGPKMLEPRGEPGRREAQLRESRGLSLDHFCRFAKLTSGTRRAMLVRPADVQAESTPAGLRLQFSLPSGVYATSLLRELL